MGDLSSGEGEGGGGIMEFYGILLSAVMLCLTDSFLKPAPSNKCINTTFINKTR